MIVRPPYGQYPRTVFLESPIVIVIIIITIIIATFTIIITITIIVIIIIIIIVVITNMITITTIFTTMNPAGRPRPISVLRFWISEGLTQAES